MIHIDYMTLRVLLCGFLEFGRGCDSWFFSCVCVCVCVCVSVRACGCVCVCVCVNEAVVWSAVLCDGHLQTLMHVYQSWESLVWSTQVCVCARFCDTNLYNDMGMTMTGITRWRWLFSTLPHVPTFQNADKSYRVRFFGGEVEMHLCLLWGVGLV